MFDTGVREDQYCEQESHVGPNEIMKKYEGWNALKCGWFAAFQMQL